MAANPVQNDLQMFAADAQRLPPAALAPPPAGTPQWAQPMYAMLQQLTVSNQQLTVSNQQQAISLAQLQPDLRHEQACREARLDNSLAAAHHHALTGLPTLPVIPANYVAGQPLPPLGPVPTLFPATRIALVQMSVPDCTTLLAAYGLAPGGTHAAKRNRIAKFIGTAPV